MRANRTKSNPVDELVFQCKAAKLPAPVREKRFHPKRRWKADLVFEDTFPEEWTALMVEVEGGVYLPKGRHTSGKGFEDDCEKYAHAMIEGYRVLRVTPRHIRSGQALAWIEALLK